MRYLTFVCSLAMALLAGLGCFAQEPEQDSIQGNWEGQFTKGDAKGKAITAQIVAQGKGGYQAIIASDAGAGSFRGETAKGKVAFEGTAGAEAFAMKIAGAEAKGKIGKSAFEMKRVEKKSATLGQQPPQGAVVLLDGKGLDAWRSQKEGGKVWELVDGGAMEVRKVGNIMSKEAFGDALYHIEFRTPLMAKMRGQARGNSGVYLHGRYEVQVLDSFGLPVADNECGGIYKKAVPKVNACLPPTEWQTYDITFITPKFDAAGAKTSNARITAVLNGITIHDNVELDSPTPGGVAADEVAAGPLLLQDHGNKVQYRNIWVKAL